MSSPQADQETTQAASGGEAIPRHLIALFAVASVAVGMLAGGCSGERGGSSVGDAHPLVTITTPSAPSPALTRALAKASSQRDCAAIGRFAKLIARSQATPQALKQLRQAQDRAQCDGPSHPLGASDGREQATANRP